MKKYWKTSRGSCSTNRPAEEETFWFFARVTLNWRRPSERRNWLDGSLTAAQPFITRAVATTERSQTASKAFLFSPETPRPQQIQHSSKWKPRELVVVSLLLHSKQQSIWGVFGRTRVHDDLNLHQRRLIYLYHKECWLSGWLMIICRC
jgi:hypothetical protein